MKKIYNFTLLFLLIGSFIQGQITVTNSTFPAPGDTLSTSTDLLFRNFDPAVDGGSVVWDFTDLVAGVTDIDRYLDPSEGADADSFPSADLLLAGDGLQDVYYEVSNNRIKEIGRAGLDPVFGAVDFETVTEGEAILRRAPLAFGDTYDNEYGFGLEIPVSALPDSLVAIFAGLVTDIRVRVDIEEEDEVDAWGMVSLPESDHDVLRMKRITTTNTRVEVRFLGSWVDLTSLPIQLPDFAAALVEPTVITSYLFFSDTDKEVVANITVDSLGMPIATTFKVDNIFVNTQNASIDNGNIVVYPNPTYGDVNFEFRSMPSDRYRVDLYDILGRKSWSKTSRKGQQIMEADFSELRRGTYLYRVFDSKGNKLTTRRLMIIRP